MSYSATLATISRPRALKLALWDQAKSKGFALCTVDFAVFVMLLGFGALHFFSPQHSLDFLKDDVFYADAGRSIVQHGFYGIQGHAETNQPPGLPLVLGFLCLTGSCGHMVFLRVMALFETLGFLVTYELFKRQVPRIVAAAICLLLFSSRIFFLLATQMVFPSFPYFFTSMCALLIARRFERAETLSARFIWGALLTVLIIASLLFASAAIAFLAAIVFSSASLFLRRQHHAIGRARLYLAVLLIGAAVQGFWMHRKAAPLDWPLPGYPQSYVEQLKVKSGNNPELGMATLADIPIRVLKNAADESVILSEAVLRRWIDVAWMSALVTGPIVLLLLGWGSSVWRRGGSIQDWYFAFFQVIYLLWPWKMEPRFFLPVAPLACLYIWRGGVAVAALARHRPRLLALTWYPIAVILGVSAWFWMHGQWIASHLTHAGLQDEASFAIWVGSAVLCVRVLWAESSWERMSNVLRRWFLRQSILRISPLKACQFIGAIAAFALCMMGLGTQFSLARANRDYASQHALPPDIQAAMWAKSNTPATAILMARYVPTVYHYSQRATIWFPPSTNAKMLMEGIRRHKIDYVLVVSRVYDYYLPPDDDGMAALLMSYPEAFQLIYQTPELRIYRPLSQSPALDTQVRDLPKK